ncbi:MAG: LysM peptidoglycan-binding domain-containing protein [Parcubacteria group bacterium]
MKRFPCMFLALLLVLGASSAWADQIRHPVTKGESLWRIGKKFGVPWQKIQDAKGHKLQSTKINPGDVLLIPETNSTQRVVREPSKKKVALKAERKDVHKAVNSNFVWRKVGGNPYKGTAEWAIDHSNLPADIKVKVKDNIKQGKFAWYEGGIGTKQHFDWMTFGKNEIRENFSTDWDLTVVYSAKDYGTDGYHVLHVQKCNNWGGWEEKTPTPIVTAPPTAEPEPPPIFKDEETRVAYEHELDAGGGLWRNQDDSADGAWWFLQYKLFLHKYEKDLAGGTLIPVVGVFARGDSGETSANYEWNNAGIGPQVGFMWTGKTAAGYPQQVQIMFRALWEHLHGANSSSGYKKDEDHILLGEYAEYLRQFAPDLMLVLYAEGWVDVSESFSSTWSGDKASSRTGINVGFKLHKDWNETWASRFGAQIGYSEQDSQWIANANIEMRYNDWLIFGPSFDYTLASAVKGAAGGYAYGPFVRIELKHIIREQYSKSRSEEVQPADHELLQY